MESIWTRAAEIQRLVPGCRIAVGHGQMGEGALEKVMLSFMRHECDLLLCTTIIENGLDIPLSNTIVVDNAQNYGLSELYQLRGRVGRSNRRAYAYLLVPSDTELSETARKRLAAMKEFSELGAGFKIAALDLELRGAGNLLGGEQHGHINAVGFDMYLKLLEEAVHELKGEELPLEVRTSMNLGLDIRIPTEYIAEEHQRLRAYKRIAEATDRDKAELIWAELAGPIRTAARGRLDADRVLRPEVPGPAAGYRVHRPAAGVLEHPVPSGVARRSLAADGPCAERSGRPVHSRRGAAVAGGGGRVPRPAAGAP